ncbi:shikimate dehydrogenase [Clostridium sp. LBM24168]
MDDFYGLIGKKLVHSFSPMINSMVLKKIGLTGNYNLFEVENGNLGKAVEALKVLGCKGTNVTIPYKVEVMKYLDEISEEARSIGAINTIKFSGDVLKGHNTDYYGFGMTLKKHGIDIMGKSVVILGTGGASMAVERYILDNGVGKILYVSRNPKKTLKPGFEVISYDELKNIENSDIIINCTPCGMYPNIDNCPVDREILHKFSAAVDLIYNPKNTLLLKRGKEMGLKTVNGLYMLIAQNVASQRIWHGMDISLEVVEQVYDEFVKLDI